MIKRSYRIIFFIAAFMGLLATAAVAQEEGYAFRLSNFSLEFLGGYCGLNPKDFNAAGSYEEAYLQYNYVTRFDYYHSLYGDNYKVTSRRVDDGQFHPITGSLMVGARLRYDLSPTLGLSFGVQFLSRTVDSKVGMIVDVQDSSRGNVDNPDVFNYQYMNSGFLLSVSAWTPQFAVHFGWDLGTILRLELLIGGGPFFVKCRSLSERQTSVTDPTGYRSDSLYVVDMKGTAKGMSGEMGGRICVKPARFLNIILEGSYSFREADSISGPGSSNTVISDSNGAQDSTAASWTGDWTILMNDSTASWGRFRVNQPQNRISSGPGTHLAKFALDLSGFQLKAGFAVKF